MVDEPVVNDPRVFNISLAIFHNMKLTARDALCEGRVLDLDIKLLSNLFLIKISKKTNQKTTKKYHVR